MKSTILRELAIQRALNNLLFLETLLRKAATVTLTQCYTFILSALRLYYHIRSKKTKKKHGRAIAIHVAFCMIIEETPTKIHARTPLIVCQHTQKMRAFVAISILKSVVVSGEEE